MMRVGGGHALSSSAGISPLSPLTHLRVRQTWWSALIFILLTLWYINPEFRHYGDAFSPLIPQDQWFLHLYQWGPDGCGTELCR